MTVDDPDPLLQAPLVPSYGVNPTFSHASTILEMKNSSNSKGRHVITNKPVKIGDVLFSEPPYASILLPEHYSSHCHHCVSLYLIFILNCNSDIACIAFLFFSVILEKLVKLIGLLCIKEYIQWLFFLCQANLKT